MLTNGTGFGRRAKVAPGMYAKQSHQQMATAAGDRGLLEFQASALAHGMPTKMDELQFMSGRCPPPPPPPYAGLEAELQRKALAAVEDLVASCVESTMMPAPPGLVPGGLSTSHINEQQEELPSRGSMGHPYYCGAPCKYIRRKSRCRDGFGCLSCHLCKWTRKTHGLRGLERIAQEELEPPYGSDEPSQSGTGTPPEQFAPRMPQKVPYELSGPVAAKANSSFMAEPQTIPLDSNLESLYAPQQAMTPYNLTTNAGNVRQRGVDSFLGKRFAEPRAPGIIQNEGLQWEQEQALMNLLGECWSQKEEQARQLQQQQSLMNLLEQRPADNIENKTADCGLEYFLRQGYQQDEMTFTTLSL